MVLFGFGFVFFGLPNIYYSAIINLTQKKHKNIPANRIFYFFVDEWHVRHSSTQP